jgi:methylmalonyl-CoA/ethylmalonyl-CoA epimerase
MTGIESAAQGSLFGRIDQVGIVVRDVEASVKEYEKFFGEGSFSVIDGEQPAVLGDGREIMIKGRLAFAQLGDVQVELIQILEGPSIHVDFLEQNGEGIHHVGVYTPTFDKDIEGFKNKGIGILQQGSGIRRYAYMDTKPFILELIEAE